MGFICQNITHVIARGIQIANRQKLQSIHSNREQGHLMRRPAAPNQVYLMYSSACGVQLTLVPFIMTPWLWIWLQYYCLLCPVLLFKSHCYGHGLCLLLRRCTGAPKVQLSNFLFTRYKNLHYKICSSLNCYELYI